MLAPLMNGIAIFIACPISSPKTKDPTSPTMSDVVEEIGADALRFIFASKKSDTSLEFDVEDLKKQDSSNPVYYVNYAHARIQTIVAWDTDEPSVCNFNYREGIAPGVDTNVIEPEDENPTERHVQVIVEFNPSTVYKFWITCVDPSGNEARTEDFVLFTPTKEKSIIDIIIENFEASFGWVKNIGL